jgi:hypothetical protein
MPRIAAESMDRLCTVEMKSPGQPRGVAVKLYEAAREEAGEALSYHAASLLVKHAEPGRTVLITSAAGGSPWLPAGETDGPLGAVAIGRALAAGAGAVPLFVTTDTHAPPIVAAARAGGLVMVDPETAGLRNWAGGVVPWEQGDDAPAAARELLERHRPTAVISVETLGPNRAGIVHSVRGRPFDDAPAYDALFTAAMELGIPTVGIGDGGNEIGFGRIIDVVEDVTDYGAVCQCPCGKGMATVQSTDALVVASVSNWGAYAVAANIALQTNQLGAFHDADTDLRMLEACLLAGAADGTFANHTFKVDGIDGRVSAELVHMLGTIARKVTERVDRKF